MSNAHEFRIVITPFCNYRCFYCHREGLTEEFTPLTLTPKDYQFMVATAKKYWGWDTVTITGGEPLISPIYKETCELISREGVRITTVTNASLLARPKEVLKDNAQINISLHSMTPKVYRNITGISYPLQEVLDTIISVRAQLPNLKIHLNATVIRGWNDSPEELEAIIKFAHRINGQAKFIDLASDNEGLIVPIEEILKTLEEIGFEKVEETKWQIFVSNTATGEDAILTRCGFGKRYADQGYRNLFINPDGVVSTEVPGDVPLNLLHEVHSRDEEAFAKKIEWLFPPLGLKTRPQ